MLGFSVLFPHVQVHTVKDMVKCSIELADMIRYHFINDIHIISEINNTRIFILTIKSVFHHLS